MRLISFDYFRGIAILFIVAGHSYGPWGINSFSERVLANIITGGTALFVFISGFFFHHVFYEKFHYMDFLEKKIENVFIPYLILSVMGIVYYVYSSLPLPYSHQLGLESLYSWTDYIYMTSLYLWTGRIAEAYWYIPFILIIFMLSPIFVGYIRLSTEYRVLIFLLLLLLAMYVQRPFGNLSQWHSVLYFTPMYMLGIIFSIHRESLIEFIKGKSTILGLIVLSLSALHALLYDGHGNFHKKEIFSYEGVDIIIIQKVALCFFFLAILQKYENRNIPILKLLASSSFAIFFIHPWILKVFVETELRQSLNFLPGMGVFIITVPILLISSLIIAYTVKLGFKKSSRYIIGW